MVPLFYAFDNNAHTDKSLSEALIFASTNPQYDDRLFIVNENCKLIIPAEHIQIVVFVLF